MKRLRLAACLAFCGPVSAGDFSSSARGTTSAPFLKLGAGARASAMGEAAAAVTEDPTALYWNPAALTRVPRPSAVLMHAALIDSSFLEYAAYAHPLGPAGALGASMQYYSAGNIPQTDETGTEVGKFSPRDLAVSLGYAAKLGTMDFLSDFSGFSFGLSAKYVHSRILASAQTAAVDAGLLSPDYFGNAVRFAFTAHNLGGRLRFERDGENLPLLLRLGCGMRLSQHWTAALDLALPRDNRPHGAAGVEYAGSLGQRLRWAGRAGFNTRSLGESEGIQGLSVGLGLLLGRFGLDYGFLPLGPVGEVHRASVNVRF